MLQPKLNINNFPKKHSWVCLVLNTLESAWCWCKKCLVLRSLLLSLVVCQTFYGLLLANVNMAGDWLKQCDADVTLQSIPEVCFLPRNIECTETESHSQLSQNDNFRHFCWTEERLITWFAVHYKCSEPIQCVGLQCREIVVVRYRTGTDTT